MKAFLIGLEKEHPVDFCFDIHAHSLATGAFMYGNVVSEDQQSEQQAFPKIFSAFAEDFSLSKTNFNKDAVKSGTARRVLGGLFPKSYTLEVSFYNYQKDLRSIPYTQKAYRYFLIALYSDDDIILAILARILHEQLRNITENIRRYRLLLVFYSFNFIFQ